ncbi:MAG TPA: flavodoxin domain-containing protein [Chitinophaga sp.]|uniref:flavodoxin domain-containing protein n=1 Tax=Chitinophaga sp. TaxID=1869181 RepID=UPI002B76698D|nr:flavodoxin domain-containing protein [Chitinophaga sp.]HVI45079.1 flavodoxin domain-containing protein [Chitinophaga sp.]
MNGIIIFKGKYGATRQYAVWLGSMLGIPAVAAGTEAQEQLQKADVVILGTSIYIGKLQLRNWIKQHRQLLYNKRLFLFLVCGTPLNETEKLHGYINDNLPAEIRNRCTCFFYPGKLEFSKLSLIDRILLTLGAKLAKSKGETIRITDYNQVSKEHLDALAAAVRTAEKVSAV